MNRRLLHDLRGGLRLAVEGVRGVTRIVEDVHGSVVRLAPPLGVREERRLGGISGLVYRSIDGTAGLVGQGLDGAVTLAQRLLDDTEGDGGDAALSRRDAVVSALNGVLGDHLERTHNPLAIEMQWRRRSADGPRPLVLIHGLCMNDRQWTRDGHDHGQSLATLGYSPLYLRYNTGRAIAANGASLAALLEQTFGDAAGPARELTLVGHSMGGLVARSAVHQAQAAGLRWPRLLRSMVFLGSPHHGAPLERGGNWVHRGLGVSPYLAPFMRLSGLRSAGITDLRHGSLLAADAAPGRFAPRDTRTPVPLPVGVACYAIAGRLGRGGDGLVQVASALGRHARPTRQLKFPAARTWVADGVNHLDLLSSAAVDAQLRQWLRVNPPAR